MSHISIHSTSLHEDEDVSSRASIGAAECEAHLHVLEEAMLCRTLARLRPIP
eukprot:CAMPEP_0181249188 /NCGR_PEP_ID=MMETSP1096-20121128/45615_1 /TAXON_ID=156174 ORGANISM="Chrysochromulina ericina, Strain CCMP281" /NCGR_SAMPLE_ID=MMETSP1096 /ASSEMBLY_ACC=CAM_ASM_000453 /LENGTH=51 /DNA_ID=CAMNT_0023346497 /DNA_START=1270 /DNA_END=1421 /DNA_ORIENTATION=-